MGELSLRQCSLARSGLIRPGEISAAWILLRSAYWTGCASRGRLRPGIASWNCTRPFLQDVLALLVQKLPEFVYDRGKSFRAWLRTIVLNRWRDRLRRKAPRAGLNAAELSDLADGDGLEALWDEEHRQYLTARALRVMQAEFQPTTWKACWEHVAADRSAADIAAELGISENAVYIATSRVLRRLRQELDGMLD